MGLPPGRRMGLPRERRLLTDARARAWAAEGERPHFTSPVLALAGVSGIGVGESGGRRQDHVRKAVLLQHTLHGIESLGCTWARGRWTLWALDVRTRS